MFKKKNNHTSVRDISLYYPLGVSKEETENLRIKELENELNEQLKTIDEQKKDISGLEKQITELKLKVELNDFYKRLYSKIATLAYGREGLLYVEKISTTSIPSECKLKIVIESLMDKNEYDKFVASKSEMIYLRYLPDIEEVKKLCP